MPALLHVGCGPKTLKDTPRVFQDGTWREIRFDIDPRADPDVLGTMTDMSAVPDGSVDAVFSSHSIEHVFPHEVLVALREFRRVLAPEGFAIINCPDLVSAAELVLQDRLNEPAYESGMGPISPLDMLYGHRASLASGAFYMAHKVGFTMRTLGEALGYAGFGAIHVKRRPPRFDLWALATVEKLSDAEVRERGLRLLPI